MIEKPVNARPGFVLIVRCPLTTETQPFRLCARDAPESYSV